MMRGKKTKYSADQQKIHADRRLEALNLSTTTVYKLNIWADKRLIK